MIAILSMEYELCTPHEQIFNEIWTKMKQSQFQIHI